MSNDPGQFRLHTGAADSVTADTVHGLAAGLCSTSASLAADPAMFMLACVLHTFLMTRFRGPRAKFERVAYKFLVGARAPRRKRRRHATYIGAIKIETYALA